MDFEQLRELVGSNNLLLKNVHVLLTLQKDGKKEKLQVDILCSQRDEAEVHNFLEERDCEFISLFHKALNDTAIHIEGKREVTFMGNKELNYKDEENYSDEND